MDSKSDLTTTGLFLDTFFGRPMPRFVDLMSAWTEIYMNYSIVFLFDDIKFSR